MGRLIRAEFYKLRTTQVWFWLLLASLAVAALFVVGPFASGAVNSSADFADVLTGASTSYIVVFVLGVLGVTTEFRYQTITPTVLTTPSRWTLITAKMISYLILGALYALACLILQLAIALPWLATMDFTVTWGSGPVPHALIALFVVVALYGIVGLGAGALLRNQVVAVTIGVIFLLALQNIFLAIPKVNNIYPYLPGGATNSILITHGSRTVNDVELLGTAGGVIVLLLWAFVPAILGASVTMNRDIT